MPRLANLAAVVLAALAAACTTVPPEQRAAACQAIDWRDYGYNDGVLGVRITDRAKLFADCTKLGHPADVDAYRAGRREGLAKYCTLENGYEVGYSGRRYRNVCPPELEPAFLQGYQQGRRERPAYDYYPYPYYWGFGYYGAPYWWFGVSHHPHRRR